jgi:RNA polymerase sigma-70 factor (ECF subfamily)
MLLAEISRMRAYARLMTNEFGKADEEVCETLRCALADDGLLRGGSGLRLFVLLRNILARDNSAIPQYLPDAPRMLAALDDRFRKSEVGSALGRLDFEDREAVILSVAVGFSDPEIGEICECAPARIRGRIHHGLERLLELLATEPDEKRCNVLASGAY